MRSHEGVHLLTLVQRHAHLSQQLLWILEEGERKGGDARGIEQEEAVVNQRKGGRQVGGDKLLRERILSGYEKSFATQKSL